MNQASQDEILADVVVISGNQVVFADNSSMAQTFVTVLLIVGATVGVLYLQTEEFLLPAIKFAAWVALLFFGLAMLFGPLWRKQITIDLAHGEVVVSRGPLTPFHTSHIPLSEFTDFAVNTERYTHHSDTTNRKDRTRIIFTRSYLLRGKRPLTLLTWSFNNHEQEKEHLGRVIENRLREILGGLLQGKTGEQ
jgi:hypothetical protein